ncbi:MAG: hypothetical protein KBT12_09020 [Bacteroidales bacterium]|nr:hypothetical protein [Candidatus Physcousia equi]
MQGNRIQTERRFFTAASLSAATAIERDILRQYINKVKEEGTIPKRIITDNPRTHAFLKDFCHSLCIILEFKRTRIPQLTRLCSYMYDLDD